MKYINYPFKNRNKYMNKQRYLLIAFLFITYVVHALVDEQKSRINFPYDGSYINTTRPFINGSLLDYSDNPVVGQTVYILIDDVQVASTVSNEHGIYSVALEQDLEDGQHTVSITCPECQRVFGPNLFVVDTTLPPISIENPIENQMLAETLVVISGITEENAMVMVFIDDDEIGNVTYADQYGNWFIECEVGSGPHTIHAQATDIAGNLGYLSAVRNFTVY